MLARDIVSKRKRGKNMKKRSFTKRFFASIARTILAIFVIAIGTVCGHIGINWSQWFPNDEIATVIVLILYFEACIGIVYGIYLISPIFIGKKVHRVINKIINHVTINIDEEYEKERYKDEKEFFEKIKELQKK